MSRKSTENETREKTISFRVTGPFYRKVLEHVEVSDEANLSDYARTALSSRVKQEDDAKRVKS